MVLSAESALEAATTLQAVPSRVFLEKHWTKNSASKILISVLFSLFFLCSPPRPQTLIVSRIEPSVFPLNYISSPFLTVLFWHRVSLSHQAGQTGVELLLLLPEPPMVLGSKHSFYITVHSTHPDLLERGTQRYLPDLKFLKSLSLSPEFMIRFMLRESTQMPSGLTEWNKTDQIKMATVKLKVIFNFFKKISNRWGSKVSFMPEITD